MPGKKLNESPLTLSDLAKFFKTVIKPELEEMVDERILQLESRMNERFDDLYKKFEDLRQEYVIANEQMKRLIAKEEIIREDLNVLKDKVSELQDKIKELEKRLAIH